MISFKKILEESNLLKEGLNINGLKPGDKITIKYGRTSFAAEFKGFTDDSEKYSEKVVFKTHAELLKHYGVKSIKELEANFDQKGDNYGKHPYMIVKEIEDGSITSLYPYNGFWAVGSSAHRASFEKLEESNIKENIDEDFYWKLTAAKLKKIINDAVSAFNIDKSWLAPKLNDKEELISIIDEMCNEFGLTPDKNGNLIKNIKESAVNEMAGDIEIVKQIDSIRNQLNKIDKNINSINSSLNNRNLDKASDDVVGAIGYLKKALDDVEFK